MKFNDRLQEHREALDGDYVASVEATKFIERMAREHPDELREWMRAHAVDFATQEFRREDARERSQAIRRVGARRFAEALESGRIESLQLFELRFVVDEKATRRKLGDMTGEDCLRAAELRVSSLKTQLMLQAFLRALHRRVGRAKVSDVFDEVRLEAIMRSYFVDESQWSYITELLVEEGSVQSA